MVRGASHTRPRHGNNRLKGGRRVHFRFGESIYIQDGEIKVNESIICGGKKNMTKMFYHRRRNIDKKSSKSSLNEYIGGRASIDFITRSVMETFGGGGFTCDASNYDP